MMIFNISKINLMTIYKIKLKFAKIKNKIRKDLLQLSF